MSLLNKFLHDWFIPTRNINMEIPATICFILVFISLLYLSKEDLTYRKIENLWVIFISYIPAILGSYLIYGLTSDFFVGVLGLFVYLYLVALFSDLIYNRNKAEEDRIVFLGTADILTAPLVTCWFGTGIITYIVLLILIILLCQVDYINNKLRLLCKDEELAKRDAISLIPCMMITYMITLFLLLI